MKARNLAITVLAVVALAGCDGEKTHSVDWYKTHETERLAKLKQCADDPGELRLSPNCVNANKAAEELSLDPKNKAMPRL
ncbi:EexN family lipoprotein [Candidatus Burkholderia verschuerenii]|uniref:EexN family lipoprotein n=1 Tax=Candidatus Burkholderia verschuerenii TaxID=242163 RepID=UPI00067C04BD|nr:EexN family lipoprotein [Candidatus Burkholderia verschuerenii]